MTCTSGTTFMWPCMLLVLSTIVSCNQATKREQALAELRDLGVFWRYKAGSEEQIEEMTFGNRSVTDDAFVKLQHVPEVEYVSIFDSSCTGKGLAHLNGLKHLKEIEIIGRFDQLDDGILQWADLPRLEKLAIMSPDFAGPGLETIGKIPRLNELLLANCTSLRDEGFQHLRSHKGLRQLTLRRTEVTDVALGHLSESTAIELLSLGNTHVTEKGLAHLASLTRLKHLGLRETRIKNLEPLSVLRELKSIDVSGCAISDDDLAALRPLKKMETVYLNDCEAITDNGINELASSLILLRLELRGTRCSDAGLEAICRRFPSLRILTLDDTKITGAGLRHLAALKSLKYLSFKNLPLQDSDLVHLSGLRDLKELSLIGTKVTRQGSAELKVHLPQTVIYVNIE